MPHRELGVLEGNPHPQMKGSQTNLLTWSDSILISVSMESMGLLLSLPRVKGTIQKLHMLSHPRMMDLE